MTEFENLVDLASIQEQASFIYQCDCTDLVKLRGDFKSSLSVQGWNAWLERGVVQALEGKPDLEQAGREFLLKWSYFSSLVLRDLTMKSATTFISFHLIYQVVVQFLNRGTVQPVPVLPD